MDFATQVLDAFDELVAAPLKPLRFPTGTLVSGIGFMTLNNPLETVAADTPVLVQVNRVRDVFHGNIPRMPVRERGQENWDRDG